MFSLCGKLIYFNHESEKDDLNWTKYTLQKQRSPAAEFQDASVRAKHFVLFPTS